MTKVLCVAAPLAVTLSLGAAPALAGQREVRIGTAPQPPARTTLVAGSASLQTMQITVALSPRNPTALRDYADGVGNPTSPDYRRYLTPIQFRDRFAPRRQALIRVEAELRRHGLEPGALTRNGLAVHVRASSAAIEHAFDIELVRVRLADGRDAVYNDLAPAVDAGVAPQIQAVIGLSSLAAMERLDVTHASAATRGDASGASSFRTSSAHVATGGPQPCLKASEVAPGQGAYTADQIATAYGFSGVYANGDQGQGVTIGAYELESNSPTDIAAYQHCYRTDATVTYDQVDGGAGKGIGQGEAALDIEQLIGLAPRAKILVYQGPNNNSDNPGTGPYDTLAEMISQDQVQVISNSWGECEALEGATDAHAEDTLLQEAATQGQTFVSAAGDSGSEDCWSQPPGGNTNNSLSADDPATQPFTIAVGGTSMSAVGPPPAETVWDDDNPGINYSRFGVQQGAGGGGISSFWPMPAWQASAAPALGVINSASSGTPCAAAAGSYCREVPDVSADADPLTSYLDYWNGQDTNTHAESGWQGTGGTSGAAPVWAALFALADASRSCRGTLVGFAGPTLYALAGASQATYFNDVTTGNNDFTPSGNSSGMYAAGVGYDMASGLGTPKAAALVPALCAQAVRVADPGQVYTFYGQHVRLRMHASLPAGLSGPISYRAQRLPVGLHIDHSTGVISGSVGRAGLRTVTVTAGSATGNYGSIRFSWLVERRPRVAAAVVGGAAPALTVTARSGAYEPGLRELTIALPPSITPARAARTVMVLSPSGQPLAHSAHFAGNVLTIRLAPAHSPVRVVFPAGTLRVAGRLVGPRSLAIRTVDRLGGQITLRRALGAV
ncbi:MAG TPA: protease pro-enzyme activation domain-containing protein [Solirubrobacteraceae bacterium]|nr:protease pro-enzyme activation domain-containing protein [Solirubrobacteraceae bacterium]